MRFVVLAFLVSGLLSACGGGSGGGDTGAVPGPSGMPSISGPVGNSYGSGDPTGRIEIEGADHRVGARVFFNMYGSSGGINYVTWKFTRIPGGAPAVAPDTASTIERVHFTPQVPGNYTIHLLVNGDNGSHESSQDFSISEPLLQASLTNLSGQSLLGEVVTLSAEETVGPAGLEYTYEWEVLSAPSGSEATLEDAGATAELRPDQVGSYEVQVTVTAGEQIDSAAISIYVSENRPPQLVIRQLPAFHNNDRVVLEIISAFDPEGRDVEISWDVAEKPAGASPGLSYTAETVELFPDIAGEYVVRGRISDGVNETERTYRIVQTSVFLDLPQNIRDAEYDGVNNRLVMISSDVSELLLVDPQTAAVERIALGAVPTAVSVSPDGTQAAVAHETTISLVDLDAGSVLDVFTTSIVIGDIVHGGNGYLYPFEKSSSWTKLRSIEVSSGNEITDSKSTLGRIFAKKQPGGDAIYGTYTSSTPADIERYDISAGVATYHRDSPYHGEYPICGNVWFSEDGNMLFTACGNAFSVSSVQEYDMIHVDALEDNLNASMHSTPVIVSLDHSIVARKVATIERAPVQGWGTSQLNNNTIRIYRDDTFELEAEWGIPVFEENGRIRTLVPQFVFVDRATSETLAVMSVQGIGTAKSAIIRY